MKLQMTLMQTQAPNAWQSERSVNRLARCVALSRSLKKLSTELRKLTDEALSYAPPALLGNSASSGTT
jgi:hypothetical protein